MLKMTHRVEAFCYYPFIRFKVTCDGQASMCCFQRRNVLGNILETDLETLWNSPLAQKIREETLKGRFHRACQVSSCPFWKKKNLTTNPVDVFHLPRQLEIDLPTSHCNIGGEFPTERNPACLMCERHRVPPEKWGNNDRLEEVCEKLRPYMRYIQAVHIQGVSEPFWKDRIFEVADYLDMKHHQNHARITSTTNGTLMTKERRDRFLEYPMSCLVWSLDAGTPEVFKKLRRLDMYDRVVENLRLYSFGRKTQTQEVIIHNNINTINIGDVEKMVETAALCKVDRLDINATYDVPEICVNKKNVSLFRDAQRRIMEKSRELGVYVTFMRDLTLDLCDPVSWREIDLVQLSVSDSLHTDLGRIKYRRK
jgi:MoaA/NifB/PqqE/SkfB family radical SAM enzyme